MTLQSYKGRHTLACNWWVGYYITDPTVGLGRVLFYQDPRTMRIDDLAVKLQIQYYPS